MNRSREIAARIAWRNKQSLRHQRPHRPGSGRVVIALVTVLVLTGLAGWTLGHVLAWMN